MKMTKAQFALFKAAIIPVLEANPDAVERYKNGDYPRSEFTKDVNRRFCFDVFYASGFKIGDGIGVIGDINGDFNDDHIYTALKQICPSII